MWFMGNGDAAQVAPTNAHIMTKELAPIPLITRPAETMTAMSV